jgi:transmembrane protein EpsG
MFEVVKEMSWGQIFESFKLYYQLGEGRDPGYDLFQKIIQIFINDYQVYLILVAVIFFAAFGSFIYKNSSRITDAMMAFLIYSVLFYAFFSITGIRQTIATSLALASFELIKKRKLLFFLILVFLASTIHKSVLIFMPFYFAPMIKNVKFFYWILLFTLPIIFAYRESLAFIFTSIGGYDVYTYYEGAGTPVFTALMLLIAIFSFLRYKEVLLYNQSAQLFYFALLIAVFFTPLTWVNPSAMRVVQYFSIFIVLLVPKAIHTFRSAFKGGGNIMYNMIVVLLIIIFVTRTNANYKFFWQ